MNPPSHGSASGSVHGRNAAVGMPDIAPGSRSRFARFMLVAGAALACVLFIALGTWQVKRLYWKLDLIARVEQRVHAPAVDAPGRERWPQITAASDEYRHVRVTGIYLQDLSVRVRASTELGSGFWLITPLRSADGGVVLVNRGFISAPQGASAPHQTASHQDTSPEQNNAGAGEPRTSTVTGLLRMSEPGGAFLRKNDPAADRWYSRDVQAIAAARNLGVVAPYFIDADRGIEATNGDIVGDTSEHPIGGMTVITFANNHLVYAITWFALALMVAGAWWWVAYGEGRQARAGKSRADIEGEHGAIERNQGNARPPEGRRPDGERGSG